MAADSRLDKKPMAVPAVMGLVLLAVTYLTFVDPWLPRERLETEEFAPNIVYILDDTGDEYVYLDADSRTIERVAKEDVVARTYLLGLG